VKRIHFRIERRKPRFPLLSQPFFLLIYIVICLGIFLIINLSRERMTDISSLKLAKEENIPPLPETPPHPVLQKKEITIQKGQTISDILTEFGFSPQEIFSLRQQVKPTYDLARIIAGKKIKFYLNDQGQFHSFEYTIDDQQFLRVRKENESYQAKLLPLPYKIQVKTIFGPIKLFLKRNSWTEILLIMVLFWRLNSPIKDAPIKPFAIPILTLGKLTILLMKVNPLEKNF